MKRQKMLWIFMGTVLFFLAGCTRIMTPDELIQPPELNAQSKEIRMALNAILPANYELMAFPRTKGGKESNPLFIEDIDGDGGLEAVALFRNKSTQSLGIISLQQLNENWVKKYEIAIDAMDIANYRVVDLDQDGLYEIVFGYENKKMEKQLVVYVQQDHRLVKIFDENYYAMDIGNFRSGQYKSIAFSNYGKGTQSNKVEVLRLVKKSNTGYAMEREGRLGYADEVSPYGVQIGEMMPGKKAVFVDLLINQMYGKSDVLSFEKERLTSYLDFYHIDRPFQQSDLTCTDIDGDGIVEIPGTTTPALQNQDLPAHMKIYLRDYYKIDQDHTLKLVRQVYFDQFSLNVQVIIPKEYMGNYTVSRTDDGNTVTFSYISKEKPVMIVPFMMLQKMEKTKWNQDLDQIVLSKSETTVTLGKLLPIPENLSEPDSATLRELIKISKEMNDFIKPVIQ